MPGFDGTGPLGRGSRTGWGLGRCPPPVSNEEQAAGQAAPAAGPAGQVPPYAPGPFFRQGYGGMGPVYGVGRGGIPRGCGRGFCGGRRGRRFW
jgi:hypothetical protein